jgi:hypothetical protein
MIFQYFSEIKITQNTLVLLSDALLQTLVALFREYFELLIQFSHFFKLTLIFICFECFFELFYIRIIQFFILKPFLQLFYSLEPLILLFFFIESKQPALYMIILILLVIFSILCSFRVFLFFTIFLFFGIFFFLGFFDIFGIFLYSLRQQKTLFIFVLLFLDFDIKQ